MQIFLRWQCRKIEAQLCKVVHMPHTNLLYIIVIITMTIVIITMIIVNIAMIIVNIALTILIIIITILSKAAQLPLPPVSPRPVPTEACAGLSPPST